MQKRDVYEEVEEALQRLMPVGLSSGVQENLEASLEDLAGESGMGILDFRAVGKWIAGLGIAAAVVLGIFSIFQRVAVPMDRDSAWIGMPEREMVFLGEADRVELVRDEGLYVDVGGSAVRKLRVRMVEESRMRDEETGFVVSLSSPREETYLVPISTF